MQHHYTAVDIDAFWARVDKNGPVPPQYPELGPCWLWVGLINVRWGYGYLWCSCGKRHRTNRMAIEIDTGEAMDTARYACHRCDNPPCVRRAHLFDGTPTDNLMDAIAKGRHHAPRGPAGERHSQAKLTDANVLEIRRMVACGALQRTAAERFGVRDNLVSRIVNRKIWRHI